MTDHPRISLAPDVLAGKPVIRGTRLSGEFMIDLGVSWNSGSPIDAISPSKAGAPSL